MKQLISVRAVIKKDGRTLLLKRANGRESILGKYELPGGKIEFNEQPEDAVKRILSNDTGLNAQTIQLFDVLTYIDHDMTDTQYLFLLYLVGANMQEGKVVLSDNYNKYTWKRLSEIGSGDVTESTELLLGIARDDMQKPVLGVGADKKTTNTQPDNQLIVYSDGGSRGNPGPSAAGFVIMNAREEIVDQGGEYLGITTNNQAEYHGVYLGLEHALSHGAVRVDFRLDSQLVANQLSGVYAIKNRELWPIYERVKELMTKFEKVTFTHIKREFNTLADGLVNKTLDSRETGV